MTLKKIEGHQVVVDPMVAELRHKRQGVRSPQPICITGFNYSQEYQMAHDTADIGAKHNEICRQAYQLHLKESFWDFLPCKGKVPIGLNGYYLKDWNDKKFSIKVCSHRLTDICDRKTSSMTSFCKTMTEGIWH